MSLFVVKEKHILMLNQDEVYLFRFFISNGFRYEGVGYETLKEQTAKMIHRCPLQLVANKNTINNSNPKVPEHVTEKSVFHLIT